MPESYDREGLIDRATDAINDGDPQKALEIAEEIRRGEGPNADEALIRGIALSSLGRTAEASDAFAEATRQAPNSHKARFNAAVHEFNAGNIEGARALAEQAAVLDPTHGSTRSLVEKIAAHGQPAPVGAVPPPVSSTGQELSSYVRPLEEEESLPWIGRMGSNWPWLGMLFAVLNFVAIVTLVAMVIAAAGGLDAVKSTGDASLTVSRSMKSLQNVPMFNIFATIELVARVGCIGWTVLDLIRRRGNFLWLMGVVPLSCLSLGWAAIPIYLLFGRKS